VQSEGRSPAPESSAEARTLVQSDGSPEVHPGPGSSGRGDSEGSRRSADETLAVHLINYTGDMHEDASHRVEYVAPLRDLPVEVTLSAAQTVLSVHRLVAGDTVPFTLHHPAAEDGPPDGYLTTRLRVPEVGPSETLLIRLANGTGAP
jgi:hypothetical protein